MKLYISEKFCLGLGFEQTSVFTKPLKRERTTLEVASLKRYFHSRHVTFSSSAAMRTSIRTSSVGTCAEAKHDQDGGETPPPVCTQSTSKYSTKHTQTPRRFAHLIQLFQVFRDSPDLLFLGHCSKILSAISGANINLALCKVQKSEASQTIDDCCQSVASIVTKSWTHFFTIKLWKLCVVRS